jgi:hypothetical protein
MEAGLRSARLVPILLLTALLACDGGGSTAPWVSGVVSGVVEVEGEGVSGARVTLSGDSLQTTVTGSSGSFTFTGLPEGSFSVSLTQGPDAALFPVSVQTATVSESQPSTQVTFTGQWSRDAGIRVRVTVDGAPFPDARVDLEGPETSSGTTDSQGWARFEGLRRGSWDVTLGGYDPLLFDFPVTERTVEAGAGGAVEVRFEGVAIPQIPDPPRGLTATATGSSTVALTWTDASDDETGFEVERSVQGTSAWSQVATPPAGTVALDDEGLSPGTTYVYRVRACSTEAGGCSDWAPEATATTDDIPPSTPSSPGAEAAGPDGVLLSWADASDNEDGFRVERRRIAGPGDAQAGASAEDGDGGPRPAPGPWSVVAELGPDVTSWEDTGLDPGTTYGYRITACNAVGCSPTSGEIQVTTDPVPPVAPGSLSAAATSSTSVALSWTDLSNNETSFEIERRPGGGTWAAVASAPADATGFQDTGLQPTSDYGYRVRACNAAGCSPWSDEATVTTQAVPPAAPTGLSATAAGSSAVNLGWTDEADNETGFQLQRRTLPGGSWSEIATPAAEATSHADGGLQPGTTYGYRIRACNGAGCSSWSAQASATTDATVPTAPTGVSASATGTSSIVVSWTDASSDETGFEVQRRSGGAWTDVATRPADATGYSDSGLTEDTTYEYRVRACNAEGCSAWAGPASATTDPAPSGPNLSIGAMYLTQGVQRPAGDAPLVADREAYLRVFAVANEPNLYQPDVRVEFYLGGTLQHTETIPAPGSSVPQSVDESSLGNSWNVAVPASLLQPGLTLEATVDPTDQVPEADEGDNGFPQAPDVRSAAPLEVTFIPVRVPAESSVGDVNPSNVEQFGEDARTRLPFSDYDYTVRAEYTLDDDTLVISSDVDPWSVVLSEINALRNADGSSRLYYGVVATSYSSGIAGLGYVGHLASVGWDKLPSGDGVAAHEWGHNLGRPHSPGCGAGGADGNYPGNSGELDAWGLDLGSLSLKSPSGHADFMSYCSPDWVSAYVWEKILDFWAPSVVQGAPSPAAAARGAVRTGAEGPGLLVWGRVSDDGLVLEPAFQVTAPAALPVRGGDYRVTGMGADGEVVFSLSFDPIRLDHAPPDAGHFAFVVPVDPARADDLTEIRLTEERGLRMAARSPVQGPAPAPGAPTAGVAAVTPDEVEVTWNRAAHAMVVIRDAATGEILSLSRSGRTRVRPSSDRIELVFSDGVRTVDREVRRWR